MSWSCLASDEGVADHEMTTARRVTSIEEHRRRRRVEALMPAVMLEFQSTGVVLRHLDDPAEVGVLGVVAYDELVGLQREKARIGRVPVARQCADRGDALLVEQEDPGVPGGRFLRYPGRGWVPAPGHIDLAGGFTEDGAVDPRAEFDARPILVRRRSVV